MIGLIIEADRRGGEKETKSDVSVFLEYGSNKDICGEMKFR